MFLDIDKFSREQVAIIDESYQKVTYGELCDFTDEMKKLELERAIVFSLCENSAGALAGIIAFETLKVVPLLLSSHIEKELLSALESIYTPSYYWVPESFEDKPAGEVLFQKYGYWLIRTRNRGYKIHDKLSLLMTTSGSTGSPKLVRYKYGNLEANAKNVAKAFGWTNKERCIADLPLQYTMGLNVINSHLVVGATILLIKSNLMSMEFWDFIKKQRGTNFTGVPFSYEIMMKLRFTRMNLPDLYTLAEGGGKLTDELYVKLCAYAKEKGKRFCPTFGTTETSARMAFCPPDMAAEKIGSIGKAIPGGELFLLDDEGNEISDIVAQGELGYRGPNVTMGYGICREDLEKGDEWQGEYHTGDIARRDEDGFYYIVGRKKRFLKLFGLRVSLDQCERLLKTDFDGEFACVGTDKKMTIYTTNQEAASKTPKYLSEKLNMNILAFQARYIANIPKNDTGKTVYAKLPIE
ncbi:MAG: AMP-binding protein [Eubacteriales bacterium]|nr:AMP-binding protein [Eubacteriales bacterium]